MGFGEETRPRDGAADNLVTFSKTSLNCAVVGRLSLCHERSRLSKRKFRNKETGGGSVTGIELAGDLLF